MRYISAAVVTAVATILIDNVHAQTSAEVANLVAYWDYGRSPPVYPTPPGTGTDDWAAAYAQAKAIVAQMSNEETQNITIGYATTANGCSGNSPGVPDLGYVGMCLNDAGNGVRTQEGVSGYPSGIHVGASWNRALAQSRGLYMGAEFKAKGINMALGPVVGPIGRVALGGRNWEGASNDPYLSGVLTAEIVIGLQENVIACTKHLVGNEQETNRLPTSLSIPGAANQSVSSNIDDKTMHELYLWPFQDAVRAGSGSIMASYNRINDSYASANSKTLNGLLKTELGFQGFVVSDWGAVHTGIASANAGLDMVMPSSVLWENFTQAVGNGSMTQSRLDDMSTRIIATWLKFAPFTNPGFGVPHNLSAPHKFVNARNPASSPTILQGALEGHVLVKNIRNALPLKAPAFISLFGYDAVAPMALNPTAGAKWNHGFESTIVSSNDSSYLSYGRYSPPGIAINGTLWVGGGSGANTPGFVNDPFMAFTTQAELDNTWLAWDFESAVPTVDPASEVCIVFINAFSTEGADRPYLSDDYSDDLVNSVASQCANTMVVIHNAGIRILDGFYNNTNVTAIIYAHLPGQQTGKALVQLMYGQQSFSGRMPYTVARQASDYGTLLAPTAPDATSDYYTQSNFTEGIYIDYKAFIKNNITPRFAFGYGLTYSTFQYSNLAVSLASASGNLSSLPASAPIVSGGNPRLFDTIATVTATVTNTGKVAAAEVAQLYIGIPKGPAKQLRGFVKEVVNPGMGVQVSFALTRRDLSAWDVVAQEWRLQSGTYKVHVGKSVLDIKLSAALTLTTS